LEKEIGRMQRINAPILLGAMASGVLIGVIFLGVLGLLAGPLFGLLYWYLASNRPYRAGYVKTPPSFNKRENIIHLHAEGALKRRHGSSALGVWKLDQKSETTWHSDKIWTDLLVEPVVRQNDNLRFAVYIKAAEAASKADNHPKAIEYLDQALSIKPGDAIASFRLAEAFERMGQGSDALDAYASALKDSSNTSEMRRFIASQIDRVKREGPRKKAPMPGLKHLGMGR
jgi:tetratricopeptide (TPR) repeat protein